MMKRNENTKRADGQRPWLMESVAGGAVLLSAGLAGIGVSGLVGWASPLALAGSVALVGGTLLTEIAASRLPVHAQARASDGERLKVGAIVAAFAALTVWNVTAGHMGLAAIDQAALADKRAPLEQAEARASAEARAAAEALAAFDGATERQAALWADSLKGLSPLAVTAGTRRIEAAAESQARREAERSALVAVKASAEAAAADAARAVETGPRPRPDRDLWAFALVLELLKGALVWFATGRERRTAAERSAEIVALAPVAVAEMTEEELRAMASRGASLQAKARHELARRARVA